MDLVAGVQRDVVIMDHANKAGEPKLLTEGMLPAAHRQGVRRPHHHHAGRV